MKVTEDCEVSSPRCLGHETFVNTEYQDDEGQCRPFESPDRSCRTVVRKIEEERSTRPKIMRV